MIDEKILMEELKTEYGKVKACYYANDCDAFFAAELSAIGECIKIVRKQQKIRVDPDAILVDRNLKCSFPQKLLDEWDSVTTNLRRYLH